jgi:two-component system sensor histidine kinase and response regulator WspE
VDRSTPFHIDAALLELFRAEVETHMAALNDGLLVLEKDPSRIELFEALMRAAHSIKGAARIVGVTPAVEIAHAIEDCFVALRKGSAAISAATMDVLFHGVDLLQRVTQIPDDATQLPDLDAAEIARITQAIAGCVAGEPAVPGAAPPPASAPRTDVVAETLPDKSMRATAPAPPQLQDFVIEAREHLAVVCDHLLHLEKSADSDATQRIQQLLRAVHSIKGGAGFFGCRAVERLAHLVESVLEGIERGDVAQESATVDILLAAMDRLAVLVDDIEHSDQWDVTDVVGRLEALLAVPADLGPPASDLRPPSSGLRPPSSALCPPPSDLRPSTSDLRPPSSDLRPPTSDLRPPPSDLPPPPSDLRPPSSDLRLPSTPAT